MALSFPSPPALRGRGEEGGVRRGGAARRPRTPPPRPPPRYPHSPTPPPPRSPATPRPTGGDVMGEPCGPPPRELAPVFPLSPAKPGERGEERSSPRWVGARPAPPAAA